MPDLFKVSTTRYSLHGSYRLPDGSHVTAGTPGAVASVQESAKWYFWLPAMDGKPGRRVPLAENKDTARKMMNSMMRKGRLGEDGSIEEQRERPLADHLAEYGTWIASTNSAGAEHVERTLARCQAVVEGCAWETIGDMNPEDVLAFLARQRATDKLGKKTARRASCRKGFGIKSSNYYIGAVKGFARWLAGERTVRNQSAQGPSEQPGAVRLGSKYLRFRRCEIDKWLEAGGTKAKMAV